MNIYHFQINQINYYVAAQNVEAAYTVLPRANHTPYKILSKSQADEIMIPECNPMSQGFYGTILALNKGPERSLKQEIENFKAWGINEPKIILQKPIQ